MKLEEIQSGQAITGLEPLVIVSVVAAIPIGSEAVRVVYQLPEGGLKERLLNRSEEALIAIASLERPWSFEGDGESFRLACEAKRIDLAFLFDPMMAVHTSNVEPLPHQITAVYESMLPRQPLRYVLADDPGAGKTVMAGLYIRELIMRADARRILIVAPGSLVEQWRDELFEKFGLEFLVFSPFLQQASPSGNPFEDHHQLIVRLDQMARNDELQDQLCNAGWDLAVFDEAHKLAAHYFGTKVQKTGRFEFAERLGANTRHLLLMTATPHNGKEADFQLFLSLLDSDRFYGKFRDGAHKVDTSDLMRRMVKEELVKFDGTPLFPERKAYTVNYKLSEIEAALYEAVTEYVKTEMGKADLLQGSRKGSVGFALTALQRRLASSPEAIYQSLKRRKHRLETRLREEKLGIRGRQALAETLSSSPDASARDSHRSPSSSSDASARDSHRSPFSSPDALARDSSSFPHNARRVSDGSSSPFSPDDNDDDDLNAEEQEQLEEKLIDDATAAQTTAELESEILILGDLVHRAQTVVSSGQDRKWDELSRILQNAPEMRDVSGRLRKLIVFTEHRDTLNYLHGRITGILGNPDAVVTIHGGTHRDERRKIQAEFRSNPGVQVLVATDAAGEGVNLQNANLMVNYDLPWNPNRLEQRFGRIHRIGQVEVCHLWNIVAKETREGDVYHRLLEKLEIESQALHGRVFDILGEVFEETSLKKLLIDAIRYGDQPEVRARLTRQIDAALDHSHLKDLLDRTALAQETMSPERLFAVKEEMDKAEARRLQPFFVRSFFLNAFNQLGGSIYPRERGRFEITHVPASLRERDRVITGRNRRDQEPVLKRYERICFEKESIQPLDKPGLSRAVLIHPGHPLMLAVSDLVLEQHANLLRQGSLLVDPSDDGDEPWLLFMLTHEVKDGQDLVLSKRLQFVRVNPDGSTAFAGWAPHLDLEPLASSERQLLKDVLNAPWIGTNQEQRALALAASTLVPDHFREVSVRRISHIDKTLAAVHDRLQKEISYWTFIWVKLKDDLKAGKDVRLNVENARRTINDLEARLEHRRKELTSMRHMVNGTPVVLGGSLVLPAGLLRSLRGDASVAPPFAADPLARSRIEQLAMNAVRQHQEAHGCRVTDVSAEKCGWDLTSYPSAENGRPANPRHIEVKGRAHGADTITVTRNEILYAFNQGDKFLLAVVLVHEDDTVAGPYYIQRPFDSEPGWGVSSINYNLADLLKKATTEANHVR